MDPGVRALHLVEVTLYDVSMATRYGWMADTSSKAFEVLVELQRKMSPADKLKCVFEMTAGMLRAYQDRVRRDYPQASEREVFLRAAALRLGNETVRRVYGWDPDSNQPV